ncbi:hypothetical protein ACVME8_002980 [Bradyrhizobium diazoefficiens]
MVRSGVIACHWKEFETSKLSLVGVKSPSNRDRYDRMSQLLILSSIFASLLSALPAVAGDIVGRASVIDGDTIEIHGTRIRLWGIDAPESDQLCHGDDSELYRCGQKAAAALAGLFYSIPRPIICAPKDRDRYGRVVALCKIDDAGLGHRALDGLERSCPRLAEILREPVRRCATACRARRHRHVGRQLRRTMAISLLRQGRSTAVELLGRNTGPMTVSGLAAKDQCGGECSHRNNDDRCLKSVFR